jgi:hypothetical protein
VSDIQSLKAAVEKYGSISAAARELGMHRRTLTDRLRGGRSGIRGDKVSQPKPAAPAVIRRLNRHLVLGIGDVHVEPGQDMARLAWIGRHIKARKFEKVIQIGDFGCWDSVSAHEGNHTVKGRQKPDFLEDVQAVKKAVGVMRTEAGGNAPETHMTMGNHEYRVQRFGNENPEVDKMMKQALDACFLDHDWTLSPFGEVYFHEGVGFTHAPINTMGRTYGGKAPENTIANDLSHDLVYGHTHRFAHIERAKIGHSRRVSVVNLGCALPYGHIEDYAKHSTTGWWWGICEIEIINQRIEAVKQFSMPELEDTYG